MYESENIQRKRIKERIGKLKKFGQNWVQKKKIVPNMETDVEIYLATISGEL